MNCCGRFNTAPSPALNADCVTSPDSSRFECYATRDVAEGEQLFVPYARGAETGAEFVGQQGSLLQSDLLGHYGFTVPNDGSWGLAPEQLPIQLSPLPSPRDELWRSFLGKVNGSDPAEGVLHGRSGVEDNGGSGLDGAAAEGQEEELRKLRLVELRDRCLEAGVEEDAMDVAMEDDVPKHAMARLLARLGAGAGAPAAVPTEARWLYGYSLLSAVGSDQAGAGIAERLGRFAADGRLGDLLAGQDDALGGRMAAVLRRLHAEAIERYGTSLAQDSQELFALTGEGEGEEAPADAGSSSVLGYLRSAVGLGGDSAEGADPRLVHSLRVRIAEKETLGGLLKMADGLEN